MKIYSEMTIADFRAWSGAVETQRIIIEANMEQEFENLIEEIYPEGIDATQLNDLLWFESDWIYESLGISEEDEEDEE